MEFTGIRFGEKHSYDDWGLFLTKDPVVPPPDPRTYYTEIPGSSGNLDLTNSLTGEVTYNDRSATFSFALKSDRVEWPRVKHEILNYLHGEKMEVVLDNDPDYYYFGRLELASWNPKDHQVDLSIKGTFEPFKYEHDPTVIESDFSEKKESETFIAESRTYFVKDHRHHVDFGVRDVPVLDLSLSSSLKLVWAPFDTIKENKVEVCSVKNGVTKQSTIIIQYGRFGTEIPVESLRNQIDIDSVVSVSVTNTVSLSVYIKSDCVTVFAEGTKYVSPVTIYVDKSDVEVFSNGNIEDVFPGENKLKSISIPRSGADLLFYSSANSGRITVMYQKGWL